MNPESNRPCPCASRYTDQVRTTVGCRRNLAQLTAAYFTCICRLTQNLKGIHGFKEQTYDVHENWLCSTQNHGLIYPKTTKHLISVQVVPTAQKDSICFIFTWDPDVFFACLTQKLKLIRSGLECVQQGGDVSMNTIVPPEDSAPSCRVNKHPSC